MNWELAVKSVVHPDRHHTQASESKPMLEYAYYWEPHKGWEKSGKFNLKVWVDEDPESE